MSLRLSPTVLGAMLLAAAPLVSIGAALAQQGWTPQRNVEVVVPMAAGGSIDLLARAMQRTWVERRLLPVSSTIVNKGGAGQVMAYHYVHQHPGNPHVVGIMSSNVLTSHVAGRMPLAHSDFTPIALLVSGSYFALAVRADSPLRTARELVETLRRNPGGIADLFAALDRLRAEAATILLVDQMAGLALALADRAYVLEGGRIVASGSTAEIARDGALEKAYLAVDL
jgi:tripartite-type tricarboxylate transporter receptor subunit TctC